MPPPTQLNRGVLQGVLAPFRGRTVTLLQVWVGLTLVHSGDLIADQSRVAVVYPGGLCGAAGGVGMASPGQVGQREVNDGVIGGDA